MAYNYNFDKNTCDNCGITKEEAKNRPVATGINHPDYAYTTSFYLGHNGEVNCAACHRENELKLCFEAMDRHDKRKNNARGAHDT